MNYIIHNKQLMAEWNWVKNNELGLDPLKISDKNHKKVWWICCLGHEWQATIKNRTSGNKCPYCMGRKVLKGYNDLSTTRPDLFKEWNWQRNKEISPYDVSSGSNKKVWWTCKLGHEWESTINCRSSGTGCPYCSGQKVLVGFNDLCTTHPQIAKEWNYKKNTNSLPTMFTAGSGKKAWWTCEYGHEWYTYIYSRTAGSGCPYCNKQNGVSEAEMIVYYYIKKYFNDAISTYNHPVLKKMELDIFIPQLSVAVEYDGDVWHQNIDRDVKKDIICNENNIRLFRIREPKCPRYQSSCNFIYLHDYSEKSLIYNIVCVLQQLGISSPDVNIKRDHTEIESIINYKRRSNSLAEVFPKIALDWHPIKNGNLTPESVFPYSSKKIYWKCHVCGYEWYQRVADMCDSLGCKACRDRLLRAVFCIELDSLFVNNHNAKSEIDICYSDIYQCCIGQRPSAGKHPVTGKPLHWKYVYDQNDKNGNPIEGAITLGYISTERVNEHFHINN